MIEFLIGILIGFFIGCAFMGTFLIFYLETLQEKRKAKRRRGWDDG